MKILSYFVLIAALFSCQETSEKSIPVSVNKTKQTPIHTNCLADYTVEGMVCQMGCVGSIRKELKMTGAVSRVEVNFVEEQKEQIIHVQFDSTLISTQKISSILNSINDRQFKAKVISKKAI
jgi:copper chaperone CopZ